MVGKKQAPWDQNQGALSIESSFEVGTGRVAGAGQNAAFATVGHLGGVALACNPISGGIIHSTWLLALSEPGQSHVSLLSPAASATIKS